VGVLAIAFMLGRIDDALWFGSAQIASATLHPFALVYVASGSAMISTIRVPKP
jgi:CDP-diacylglycerol--serine O-phosphatidyltransferase